MLKITPSQKQNDCGVSALATALNVPYSYASSLIWPKGDNKYCRTKTAELIRAIKRSGTHKTKQKRLTPVRGSYKPWRYIPISYEGDVAIVKTQIRGANWHWVVWDGFRIYDPCLKKPVTPSEYGFPLVSYLRIEPKVKND